MRCSGCGSENSDQARFCIECGTPLMVTCAKCSHENRSGAKFCEKCGALLGASPPIHLGGHSRDDIRGERRHLTVLFSDLVGSTEMASHLDPEEWHEIAADYQRATAREIERFGGRVDQYLGDGVMASFGYPRAHENDAERAVSAGLAILEGIKARNEGSNGPNLSVRIGIHTGSVVVVAGGGKDSDIYGDVPSIASRVQTCADRDTVLITAATHRLVPGLFVIEERGAQTLKGVAGPVELFRIVRPSSVHGRFHLASAAHKLTPLVGRDTEVDLLWNCWERARDGVSQLAFVVGEPGIGKSRLVQEFHRRLTDTPHTWVECGTAPFFQDTPFYPVVEMLQQTLALRDDCSVEGLERTFSDTGLTAEDAVPLVARMLGLPVPGKYPASFFPPEQERRKLLVVLSAWMLAVASQRPLVIVVEDLHWADPSTLELLQSLSDGSEPARLLLLYTARPEFRPSWPSRSHHVELRLNPLTHSESREMALGVGHQIRITRQTVETVVERSGGVPLFVEELMRAIIEGVGSATSHEIPSTLHDSLMARLDRLGEAKQVAQIGAVLGHEFSYEIIRLVSELPESDLKDMLAQLVEADLLYARGTAPSIKYLFKHALVQEAAYEALLKSRRRELHKKIARVIAEHFPEIEAARPEILAHHYSKAGQSEQALAAWQQASKVASARGALKEAEEHCVHALAILGSLPETRARDQHELIMRLALGQVSMAIRGYTAPETAAAYERARDLGKRIGDPKRVVLVLAGLTAIPLLQGDMPATRALADQVMGAAERDGRPAQLVWGHYLRAVASYHRGDLMGAWGSLGKSSALYREEEHRSNPQDPGVESFMYGALTAWQLGLADTARARIGDAIALADRLHKPYALCLSRFYAAFLNMLLRQPRVTQEFSETVIELTMEQQFPVFLNAGKMLLGWALAEQGRVGEGLSYLQEALNAYTSSGYSLSIGIFLALLAEAKLRAGATDEAVKIIHSALEVSRERMLEHAHVLWLQGSALVKKAAAQANSGTFTSGSESTWAAAEQSFRDVIALGNTIGTKSYALRAATELGWLLKSRGANAEGRTLLAPIYESLLEGSDTRDVLEATALLEQLR